MKSGSEDSEAVSVVLHRFFQRYVWSYSLFSFIFESTLSFCLSSMVITIFPGPVPPPCLCALFPVVLGCLFLHPASCLTFAELPTLARNWGHQLFLRVCAGRLSLSAVTGEQTSHSDTIAPSSHTNKTEKEKVQDVV